MLLRRAETDRSSKPTPRLSSPILHILHSHPACGVCVGSVPIRGRRALRAVFRRRKQWRAAGSEWSRTRAAGSRQGAMAGCRASITYRYVTGSEGRAGGGRGPSRTSRAGVRQGAGGASCYPRWGPPQRLLKPQAPGTLMSTAHLRHDYHRHLPNHLCNASPRATSPTLSNHVSLVSGLCLCWRRCCCSPAVKARSGEHLDGQRAGSESS
jgi:hypothetical protein